MNSRAAYSRFIGALFLSAMLLYGIGFALVTSVVGASDFLSTVPEHQTTLVLGAFLMLLNSVAVVSIAVLIFPILERHSKRIALAYLAGRTVEAVMLALGVIFLLMIVPLSHQSPDAGVAKALGSLLVQSNTTAYQIAVISLGLGSALLCWLLRQSGLVPLLLAQLGLISYAVFTAGGILEIFGIHIGLALSVPGGLFELAFGFWLLIKGFQPEAYGPA